MDLLDHGHVCGCGVQAVEDILRTGFRVDVSKALDPTKSLDFVTIVARLSRAMSRATQDTEVEILNKALNALDVDWPNLTATQRNRVVAAARASLTKIPSRVIPPVTQELTVSGPRTMRGTRRGVRRGLSATFRAQIGVSLALRDQVILDHLVKSQSLFITDEYGRRREAFGRVAKSTVEEGLRDGLGRDEITNSLQNRLGPAAGLRKSRSYWNVIAGTFTNRSRVYASLASFEDAGIESYTFSAVVDEVTTDQCRFMDGKTFTVSKGLQRFAMSEAAEDPQEVKNIQPWIRAGRSPNGDRILFTEDLDGTRTPVATVKRSGVGTRDDLGSFSNARSTSSLEAKGISMPPVHGNCRSTVNADV